MSDIAWNLLYLLTGASIVTVAVIVARVVG